MTAVEGAALLRGSPFSVLMDALIGILHETQLMSPDNSCFFIISYACWFITNKQVESILNLQYAEGGGRLCPLKAPTELNRL